MPKEPENRVLRKSKVSKLNEISTLAVIADLIDVDVLRAEPDLAAQVLVYGDDIATFTPDEWEELQALMRLDHSSMVGCLRQRRHERLLRDPDTPQQRR